MTMASIFTFCMIQEQITAMPWASVSHPVQWAKRDLAPCWGSVGSLFTALVITDARLRKTARNPRNLTWPTGTSQAKKYNKMSSWTSLVGQWLRLCALTAGDMGLIPGWGTKNSENFTWPKKTAAAGRQTLGSKPSLGTMDWPTVLWAVSLTGPPRGQIVLFVTFGINMRKYSLYCPVLKMSVNKLSSQRRGGGMPVTKDIVSWHRR